MLYSFSQDDTAFFFPASHIKLKVGFVSLLKSWNDTPPFNTILYDSKFVTLLYKAVCGKNSDISNNQRKFIHGIEDLYKIAWLNNI